MAGCGLVAGLVPGILWPGLGGCFGSLRVLTACRACLSWSLRRQGRQGLGPRCRGGSLKEVFRTKQRETQADLSALLGREGGQGKDTVTARVRSGAGHTGALTGAGGPCSAFPVFISILWEESPSSRGHSAHRSGATALAWGG